MTDEPTPPPVDEAAREAAARQRFFIIGLFRLAGAFIVMFGFAIMLQRFGWVQGQKAKIMGAIVAVVGLFQFMIIPRMLLSAWRTPPSE